MAKVQSFVADVCYLWYDEGGAKFSCLVGFFTLLILSSWDLSLGTLPTRALAKPNRFPQLMLLYLSILYNRTRVKEVHAGHTSSCMTFLTSLLSARPLSYLQDITNPIRPTHRSLICDECNAVHT